MFVGTISFAQDSSSLFSDLINALTALPAWLLIAAGIYICLQIIQLVIYRNMRHIIIFNVFFVLMIAVIAFILDKEIAKSIQESGLYNDDSFVGAKYINYIIHTVILSIGSIYTIIYMIINRGALKYRDKIEKAKRKIGVGNIPLVRSEKIMLGLSGGLLMMLMVLSFFTCSGAKVIIDVNNRENETVSRLRYTLPVKEGEKIRVGSYIFEIKGWDEEEVEMKTDQYIQKSTSEKLRWNVRYAVEDDNRYGTKHSDCILKFTR